MRLVIIESPYAGDVERNERYARACMRDSLERGEAPYASHLLFTQPGVLDDTVPEEREQGMEAGLAWGRCAALTAVYVDLGVTEGMRQGIARATAEGRRIVYREVRGWGDPMSSRRRFLEGRCRHEINEPGTIKKTCACGIDTATVRRILTKEERAEMNHCIPAAWPCVSGLRGPLACDGYEPWTEEEIQAHEDKLDKLIDAFRRGVSACCGAEIDTSHVITEGEYENHGPRLCSKCGALAYMV